MASRPLSRGTIADTFGIGTSGRPVISGSRGSGTRARDRLGSGIAGSGIVGTGTAGSPRPGSRRSRSWSLGLPGSSS